MAVNIKNIFTQPNLGFQNCQKHHQSCRAKGLGQIFLNFSQDLCFHQGRHISQTTVHFSHNSTLKLPIETRLTAVLGEAFSLHFRFFKNGD